MSAFQNKKATRVARGLLAAAALATCQEALSCPTGQVSTPVVDKKVCTQPWVAESTNNMGTGVSKSWYCCESRYLTSINDVPQENFWAPENLHGQTINDITFDPVEQVQNGGFDGCAQTSSTKDALTRAFALRSTHTPNYTNQCRNCLWSQYWEDGECLDCPFGLKTSGNGVGSASCNTVDDDAEASAKVLAKELDYKTEGECGYAFSSDNYGTKGLYAYSKNSSSTYAGCAFFGKGGPFNGAVQDDLVWPKVRPSFDKAENFYPTNVADATVLAKALNLKLGNHGNTHFHEGSQYHFAGNYAVKGLYAYKSGDYAGMAFFGLCGQNVCAGDDAEKMQTVEDLSASQYRPTGYDPKYETLSFQMIYEKNDSSFKQPRDNKDFDDWLIVNTYNYGCIKPDYADCTDPYANVSNFLASLYQSLPSQQSDRRRALEIETPRPDAQSENGIKIFSVAHGEGVKADDKKVDDKQSGMKRSAGDEEESKIHSIVKRFKFNVEQLKP